MRRGATLVEVLVCCAVLATLSGLLYPVLSRATGQARVTACASRLHQVWLGYRLAAMDRECRMQDLIAEETYRYTGGEALWRCVTSTESERRYYLRLPVPESPQGDAPLLGDYWHRGTRLWVTLQGSVRSVPEGCR